MDKFEINKIYPQLYSASQGRVKMLSVPSLRVLAISGDGEKGSPRFVDSVAALHAVAYGIKALSADGSQIEGYINFNLSALEILWNTRSGSLFNPDNRDDCMWEICVVVPGFVTQKVVNLAVGEIIKHNPNPRISDVHINELQEKKSAQIIHTGSYATISKDYEQLMNYIKRKGLKPSARFHEIYLNDPMLNSNSRLKVLLRQPVVSLN